MSTTETVNSLATYQPRPAVQTVSLCRLIDFCIQSTYHELIVLTELLPRKTDMERKIAIVNYATRTRQLFVRLLGLVKWAGSASKVEKCATIVSFLDKQSMRFIETADALSSMAREILVQARLPSFQLPCAVEVLTLGTYSKLPTCIRDRIVPPDPITASEKRSTLLRLNHIIQQRLVSSNLPIQMRNLKIEFGRVTFHVDYEFELSLTLMGDSPTIPWRVLGVEILVEDKEIGDGKDLVHPLQLNYIQHLVQNRLTENAKPLVDAYSVLHSFCLSLQLEVLHAQAIRLSRERLGEFIKTDEYCPGRRLSLNYWRDQQFGSSFGCKLIIEMNALEPSMPLVISHLPELQAKAADSANQAIKSDHLSVEKLLIHTTHERAKQMLQQIKQKLQHAQLGECVLSGSPVILQLSFLQPCMPSEKLLITVDTLTGQFLVHMPQFENCTFTIELQNCLRKDMNKVKTILKQLRIWICKERCKKTVESLPVQLHENVPLVGISDDSIINSQLVKIFFQFNRHHDYYLMGVFKEIEDSSEVNFRYYLLNVDYVTLDSLEAPGSYETELPKTYLKLKSLLELDVDSIIRRSKFDSGFMLGKRKIEDLSDASSKKTKVAGYFVSDLAHLISFCDEKLAFGTLSSELQKRGISHQIRTMDEAGFTHYIDIVQLPSDVNNISKLTTNLLSCNIRLQGKGMKVWLVTLSFCNCPIQTHERSSRKTVYIAHDFSSGTLTQIIEMVDELLENWIAICKLYDVVSTFSSSFTAVAGIVEIKSFSYKKLVLGYGLNKSYMVTISWKSAEKRFQLCFGISGVGLSSGNPHVLVSSQLQQEFNQHQSINTLIQTLSATLTPVLTIANMASIPLLGVINSRPQVPVMNLSIMPQSSTHIRLLYRNIFCVDVLLQNDGLVAIRDGAYSLFDKGKVLEELIPIQSLKAFLNKFVDKNAGQTRRLSQTEDDNPPSPVPQIDSVESYLFCTNQRKTNSPLSMSENSSSLRNLHHLGSNPNTPVSPHTSLLQGYVPSPSTGFPLGSPPSHGLPPGSQIVASPSVPGPNHPEPSPANMFGVNSPVNPLHASSPSFLPTPSPSAPVSTHLQSPANCYITSSSNNHDPTSVSSPFQAPGPGTLSMSSPAGAHWPGSPIPRPSPRSFASAQSPLGGGQGIGIGTSPQPNPHGLQSNSMQSHHHFQQAARLLPQRSWAAAIPTLLTHQGFENMCRPNTSPDGPNMFNSVYSSLSQLERFLGCVFLRRHLHRVISTDENFNIIHTPEPGIIQFKNDLMQFKISLHPTTMQSLHLKILPTADNKVQWIADELETLERFFENKVVCAPYKPNAFLSFGRLLNTPVKILKDCIQLMKLEMIPDRNLKWILQFCLTIPPSAHLGETGMSAIIMFKNTTLLFFIQLTRSVNLPMGMEPQSVVIPFVYDMNNNTLNVAPDRRDPTPLSGSLLGHISTTLKRYFEIAHQTGECSIFPAIREVMANDHIL